MKKRFITIITDDNLVHRINTDHIVEIKYYPDTDETQFVLTTGEVWIQGVLSL